MEEMGSALRPVQGNPPGLIPQRSIPDTWRRAEERERKEGYGRWMEEEGSALRPVQGNPPGLIPRGSIPDTRRRAEEKEEKGFRYTIIFIYL